MAVKKRVASWWRRSRYVVGSFFGRRTSVIGDVGISLSSTATRKNLVSRESWWRTVFWPATRSRCSFQSVMCCAVISASWCWPKTPQNCRPMIER